jgi:hypothetical protein
MALGPGRYDDVCTFVRLACEADAVLLIVLGGKLGNGFSCQGDLQTTLTLPPLLDDVAKQIRESGPFET